MQSVNEKNWDEVVVQSTIPVIVDFYATWCGPCKLLKPVLNEISSNSEVKVVMLDTDECPEISDQYNVNALPTVIVFKGGKEHQRLVGLSSKEKILEAVR
jgi:thioredoxin 1